MKITTGTVTHGQIVVEGEPFSEGEKVTILSHDHDSVHVTAEEKRLLLQSLAQAKRGEYVDMDDLLAELDESN